MQDGEVPAPEPIIYDYDAVMAAGKTAFRAADYQAVVDALDPAVRDGRGPAMLLAADAHFALGTPRDIAKATLLYERSLYEDTTTPFADHSYYQLASIYLDESERARQEGKRFEAREQAAEADFYLSRLVKKYPESFYRDRALNKLLDLTLSRRNYPKLNEYARLIWDTSVDAGMLNRVEPIIFLEDNREEPDPAAVEEAWQRHKDMIRQVPELLSGYALLFDQIGDARRASELYLLAYNLWPDLEDGATSLRRLADLHKKLREWDNAAFLYARIIEDNPGTEAEAYAWIGAAEMMERGYISTFRANKQDLTYLNLVEQIRTSVLDDAVRAAWSFKLANYEAAFGSVDRALQIMRNLVAEYERGAFVGLYRGFYQSLLFTTLERRFDEGDYWALDSLYSDHQGLLAFTTESRYPHMVAKAYVALDLPSSAIQVYENMWNYKDSIRGFDLAFEAPLTDYLELLNHMRKDTKLNGRLQEYIRVYREDGRFADRLLYVRTLWESRNLSPEAFLAKAAEHGFPLETAYHARRMRRVAVTAQELPDYTLADDLYEAMRRYAEGKPEHEDILLEAELYQADRLYFLGNYFEAERRFRSILNDTRFADRDRDWAYLQIARLHELKGEMRQALRIYGQLAYAPDPESRPWAVFSQQRLVSIANQKKLDELERTLGEF